MLNMPGALVPHQTVLTLLQQLSHERRNIRLVAELRDGSEEGLEVEDDGAGEGQAAQGLPVDAQVDAREGERGGLRGAVGFARVARRHPERGVDFEAPGAALDGAGGGEFGEVALGGVSGGGSLMERGREGGRGAEKRGGSTDPLRIPSSLCSPGWARGSP